MKRILFLTQGDRQTASSRFRVYQFLPTLEKAGFQTVVHPAVLTEEHQEAFMKRSWKGQANRAFRTFTRRIRDLHDLRDFDFVFVQKPILPAPLFNMELRMAKEARMIFDFDDAVFARKPGGSRITHSWSQVSRISQICKRSFKVVVGNEMLADFVRQNAKVEPAVLPTVVDVDAYDTSARNVAKRAHKIPVVGWVGSPSTQPELTHIMSALIDLHSRTPFVFRAIGGAPSAVPVRFPIEWKAWDLRSEIQDIAHLDYGLAPLQDSIWNRGKCGLKVLQYWAAGVPVVASPVGVYKEMIQDGVNGLLATHRNEWSEKLLTLIKNSELRDKLVANGFKTVREKYDLKAVAPKFLELFKLRKDSEEESKEEKKEEASASR
jgi:glycosyltransferase involved in cell wall biosynthesis